MPLIVLTYDPYGRARYLEDVHYNASCMTYLALGIADDMHYIRGFTITEFTITGARMYVSLVLAQGK